MHGVNISHSKAIVCFREELKKQSEQLKKEIRASKKKETEEPTAKKKKGKSFLN